MLVSMLFPHNIVESDAGQLVTVWAIFVPHHCVSRQVVVYIFFGAFLLADRNSRHHRYL